MLGSLQRLPLPRSVLQALMSLFPLIEWTESGEARSARWRSESGSPVPGCVRIADDRMTADTAYRYACQGTALLWRGDFQNARQSLRALARRAEQKSAPAPAMTGKASFVRHRQVQAQRARILSMLLLPLDADYGIPLRRAPNVQEACLEAYGPGGQDSVVSLRELLGLIGAHEWRRQGVEIPVLGGRIHPHYGVFAPIRGEYVDLVAQAPLPGRLLAFDIGTGSGVLAAVLAHRGVARIVATDLEERALACARENLARLGYAAQVALVQADLFPEGRADLVVCNPPWLPGQPSAPIEHAIYDPDSRMLLGFLEGLAAHLAPAGEGWLVLSDLAEHLGLRTREELLAAFDNAGLRVVGRLDVRPRHRRVTDSLDPLHAARVLEVTSLWRLMIR